MCVYIYVCVCVCPIYLIKLCCVYFPKLKLGEAVLKVDVHVDVLDSPSSPKEDVYNSLQQHISDLQVTETTRLQTPTNTIGIRHITLNYFQPF